MVQTSFRQGFIQTVRQVTKRNRLSLKGSQACNSVKEQSKGFSRWFRYA